MDQGHVVHIICREYQPEKIDFVGQLWQWKSDGICEISVSNQRFKDSCILHQIPYGDFYPVYITGKKSSTVFKEFVDLTDEELNDFKKLNHKLLLEIFSKIKIDILHANHLVMQPSLAIDACKAHNIPLIIYPHGSAIEYAVKKDPRYLKEAQRSIEECQGLIIGNNEVRDRICHLFPGLEEMILSKTQIVGVGVDSSLFSPTAKSQRQNSITTFIDAENTGGSEGKSPQHVQLLHTELKKGNYQAIISNNDLYVQNNLDTNIAEKLLALDLSAPIIIFVGALTIGKGLQSLITALPVVYEKFPGAQLVVIGAGDFREYLEAYIYALANKDLEIVRYLSRGQDNASENSVNVLWDDVITYLNQYSESEEYFSNAKRLLNQVVFLGRFNHQQLSHIFPCADLAVFPSVIPEAYPLVLMESLANGVLPMVSYFSGFKDAVDELEQFLDKELVSRLKIPMDREGRVKVMAENIIELFALLKSKDFSSELSKIAQENYDWNYRAKQMVAAYERVR